MAAIDSTWVGRNGSPLGAMIRAGENSLNQGIGAASGAVSAANTGAAAIRNDTMEMRNQARIVNSQANAVDKSANALAALVPELDPYRAKLDSYGDDFSNIGNVLQERADDVFGQGGALMNLDRTASGLAGEYMKIYDLLSPDRYVSRAASDTQAAIDNTLAQNERALARRGVSAGSGALQALRSRLANTAAAAIAGAKTRARQQGLDEQAAYLDKMSAAAKSFYDMGNTTESQALSAKGAAADAVKDAANVIAEQGSLISSAGELQSKAGALYANAATIYGNAGELEGKAAGLGIDAAKVMVDVVSKASSYYQGIAQSMISADAQTTAARIGAEAQVASAIARS